MEKLNAIRLMLIEPWTLTSFKWGNRRTKKWMKKNDKDPIEEKYDFERRHQYITKKLKTFIRRRGVNITTEGRDYLPKGAYILTPNFTSSLAIPAMYAALGEEREAVFVFDKQTGEQKFPGYAKASNSFFVDWEDEERAINTLNAAASFAKTFNRALIIFPEQTPAKERREYNPIAFKLAQKYFLPVVPVSISNLDKVNYRDLEITNVKVKFHDQMKPMNMLNLKPERLATQVKAKIEKEL